MASPLPQYESTMVSTSASMVRIALGTRRNVQCDTKEEDAKKKGRPNDDDALRNGLTLGRDSRPDACVMCLAHASGVRRALTSRGASWMIVISLINPRASRPPATALRQAVSVLVDLPKHSLTGAPRPQTSQCRFRGPSGF